MKKEGARLDLRLEVSLDPPPMTPDHSGRELFEVILVHFSDLVTKGNEPISCALSIALRYGKMGESLMKSTKRNAVLCEGIKSD